MDSRYRRYSAYVPKYLVDRPRDLVKHCLKKISLAKSVDKSALKIVDHGIFSYTSYSNGMEQTYTINFGDNESMPSCSCPSWTETCYPCKHFFAIFGKYPQWQWSALSPLYIQSPYLLLDKFDEDKGCDEVEQNDGEKNQDQQSGGRRQGTFFNKIHRKFCDILKKNLLKIKS